MNPCGQPPSAEEPPEWAVEQAKSDLFDVHDTATIIDYALELTRSAAEQDDERHDQYDDLDQGGEG